MALFILGLWVILFPVAIDKQAYAVITPNTISPRLNPGGFASNSTFGFGFAVLFPREANADSQEKRVFYELLGLQGFQPLTSPDNRDAVFCLFIMQIVDKLNSFEGGISFLEITEMRAFLMI